MRITILAHPDPRADETFGATVGQVAAGLRKGFHRVSVLGVHHDIGRLISSMKRRQPDLIFNLMDRDPGEGPRSAAIVGLLDLLGLPYTGSCPGEFYIQEDPTIARKLLGSDPYPLENGCDRAGADFHVGVIGNESPSAFEAVGRFETASSSAHPSFSPAMQACNACGARNGERLQNELEDAAVAAYRALRVRDYGIVDLRLVNHRDVEPVGVRTECDLGESGELARSASGAGLDYVGFVNRIADLAMERAEQQQLVRLI